MKFFFISLMVLMTSLNLAQAQESKDTLYIYGPGGPFGPIKECAQIYGSQEKMTLLVFAGPDATWIQSAREHADIFFGGAEYMLTQFTLQHPELIDAPCRVELYERDAAILVRPTNPKNIHSMEDLARPGIKILDVNGAGQFGLWEDIAGKQNLIGPLQKNIFRSFSNTALGIAAWKKDSVFDAWITYASWHNRLEGITQMIKIPERFNVFRGTPVVLSTITRHKKEALGFIKFMQSSKGHHIFKKWGWK